MDVFLEDQGIWPGESPLVSLAVARPLKAFTCEELIAEASALSRQHVRYVAVRRQQAKVIGEELVREVLSDSGISVSTVGFAGGFTGALGMSFRAALADVRRGIDTARTLNAKSLVVVPGERGLHTYRHAERTVKDGLSLCGDLAAGSGIRLLVPTDTVLAGPSDCFRPKDCPLKWLQNINTSQLHPMIVVRGTTGAWRLPRGWRNGLAAGGCIRICNRCKTYDENARLMNGIIRFLNQKKPHNARRLKS